MLPGHESITEGLKERLGDNVECGVVFGVPLDGHGEAGRVFDDYSFGSAVRRVALNNDPSPRFFDALTVQRIY